MDHRVYIEKAVRICGGTQQSLAEKAGITQAGVHWLLSGEGKIAPETALKIESATEGRVTRYQLRPDIFGKAA